MSEAISGHITAFFLFDVAEADRPRPGAARARRRGGGQARPQPTTPPHVQYRQPPITIEGHAVAMAEAEGFDVRFKAFDYGVISVALTRRVSGTWSEWLTLGLSLP